MDSNETYVLLRDLITGEVFWTTDTDKNYENDYREVLFRSADRKEMIRQWSKHNTYLRNLS